MATSLSRHRFEQVTSAYAYIVIRMGLAKINPAVGDIDGNVDRALRSLEWADRAGAQVLVLPELVVTGYPPEDLVLKPSFVAANNRAVEQIAGKTGDLLTVVGFVDG